MELKDTIRNIPDFPQKGILFRDITTLLKDADAYHELIERIVKSLEGKEVDLVVGPEARGFVIGSALAYALHAGFVLARKPGKLPCTKSIPTLSSPARRSCSWTICSPPAARRSRPSASWSRPAAKS